MEYCSSSYIPSACTKPGSVEGLQKEGFMDPFAVGSPSEIREQLKVLFIFY